MPEHIHLLITEPEVGTPSTVMQVLKQRTARASLAKKKRSDSRQHLLFGEILRTLAGACLRLQCMEVEEAGGEAEIHASQTPCSADW
jgi:hypothetical protein